MYKNHKSEDEDTWERESSQWRGPRAARDIARVKHGPDQGFHLCDKSPKNPHNPEAMSYCPTYPQDLPVICYWDEGGSLYKIRRWPIWFWKCNALGIHHILCVQTIQRILKQQLETGDIPLKAKKSKETKVTKCYQYQRNKDTEVNVEVWSTW